MRNTAPARVGAREAAEIIGISRSTLTYWMLTGRIAPAEQIDSPNGVVAYLFDRSTVEALAAERAAS